MSVIHALNVQPIFVEHETHILRQRFELSTQSRKLDGFLGFGRKFKVHDGQMIRTVYIDGSNIVLFHYFMSVPVFRFNHSSRRITPKDKKK